VTRIDFDIIIDRSVDDVFAVLTDPERTPTWSASAEEERWITPPPHGLGSRRMAVTRSLGRRRENEAEVIAFEPGRAWTMRSVRGPAFEATARFGEVGTGTRVEWTWTFSGAGGALMRVFAPVFRQRFGADLETLKEMMERGDL
jgi:uncharacterized protein YndB with AHSA1/START domain